MCTPPPAMAIWHAVYMLASQAMAGRFGVVNLKNRLR